ncbi:MAG: glycosyltransferase [Chloracidobacterium sp. CP2_5A]|nr:MAG: glycosyltransferase [Chloracidobacterium sp. CP2_5A]
MRVLFVVPYLGARYGGIAKVVRELAQAVGRAGATADIITTDADGDQRRAVTRRVWLGEDGYRVMYFPCWHRKDFILSPSLAQWFWRRGRDYDLVHTHSIFAPLIAAVQLGCRRLGLPYVTTPHGMLEPWALAYKAWKKRAYYDWIERPSLRGARMIQATASQEAKHIGALALGPPVELIPNGLHRAEFESWPDREAFYADYPALRGKRLILFFGRIDPKKGLDLLAPAFARVHAKHPGTHLLVVGQDNVGFLPRAKQFFIDAGCMDAVTFAGWMSGPPLYAMLRSVELHIAPSYSEGFSMGILMCLAAGAPTIMTTGCNFPEAGAAGAARIADAAPDALAEALDALLSDPASARAMGARAREFILHNYTWDRIAQRLLTAYERMLAHDHR